MGDLGPVRSTEQAILARQGVQGAPQFIGSKPAMFNPGSTMDQYRYSNGTQLNELTTPGSKSPMGAEIVSPNGKDYLIDQDGKPFVQTEGVNYAPYDLKSQNTLVDQGKVIVPSSD